MAPIFRKTRAISAKLTLRSLMSYPLFGLR
jgi:hypothetical protein